MPAQNSKSENMCLMDEASYQEWRSTKLEHYPRSADELRVEIDGLMKLGDDGKAAILAVCGRANMAIYRCLDTFVDRDAVREFASNFGLRRPDLHLCATMDGVSELSVVTKGTRAGYIPYSNRSLSWHTDGYYNRSSHQVRAVVLHCATAAATGGENALLDPEIVYIRLRDKNPGFITALAHQECMTIPANMAEPGEIRAAVSGPVFSVDASGALHMRYSARKRHIQWRDDGLTRAARECLSDILADENGQVLHYRLQPGEGLISNNVLHNRTAFNDGPERGRLLYRARFFDRIESSCQPA